MDDINIRIDRKTYKKLKLAAVKADMSLKAYVRFLSLQKLSTIHT